jgi:hypothetical protein
MRMQPVEAGKVVAMKYFPLKYQLLGAHVSASHFRSLITESSAALHDNWSYGSMQGTSQGTSSQGALSEGTSFWDAPFHSFDNNFSQGYSYGTSSSS